MALRYWVGGTANWDATAGTKWSLTSGGAGGQAVPTASDDVFFNASSGSGTVTITSNVVAKTINCAGFTGTIAGNTSTIVTVSGNVTLSSSAQGPWPAPITIAAASTLLCNSSRFASITVGNTITATIGDTFTGTGFSLWNTGTIAAGGRTVTVGSVGSPQLARLGVFNANGATVIIDATLRGAISTAPGIFAPATFSSNATTTITFRGGASLFSPITAATYPTIEIAEGATLGVGYLTNSFGAYNFTITTLRLNSGSTMLLGSTSTYANNNVAVTSINTSSVTNGYATIMTTTFGGDYNGLQRARISKASGTMAMDRLILRDIIFAGGATWTANNTIDLGNVTGVTITPPTSSASIVIPPVKNNG